MLNNKKKTYILGGILTLDIKLHSSYFSTVENGQDRGQEIEEILILQARIIYLLLKMLNVEKLNKI